jgi:hypothetical protein
MASTAPPGPPNYAQTSAARQHVEWFLSMSDRENIRRWRGIDHTIRSRRSITTRILNPFWEWCTHFVPPTVAPNLLSLAGTTCILQAYYTTYFYYNDDPSMATATAMFLIFAYMTLDGMDGKHARRLRQQSPVGPRGSVCMCISPVCTCSAPLTTCAHILAKQHRAVGRLSPTLADRRAVVKCPGQRRLCVSCLNYALSAWRAQRVRHSMVHRPDRAAHFYA